MVRNDIINFIWDTADLLRNLGYQRGDYRKVILPLIVLKRFDCVLQDTKDQVLETYEKFKDQIDDMDDLLKRTAKQPFYNTSKYTFSSLLSDPENLEENFRYYINSFSKNVTEIFDKFKFSSQIDSLVESNGLYYLLDKFNNKKLDFHPDSISNHEMGNVFEHLVRKFAETANDEAGDHFTPREVIGLMTHLMFDMSKDELSRENIVKTIYDPACGTGGMLTFSKEHILRINDSAEIELYGQENANEIYAVSKSDLLIKGENADNIKFGSTLSNDLLRDKKFDYILSNPPYGVKWEADKDFVLDEAKLGFSGRFGAGTPRINDGQLLFIQHMISKMKVNGEKSRICAITNGSPLFTGDAGSGESDIRKWIIQENDYLEAVIAMPNQLFYNTGIGTYIWVMTNQKEEKRKGKIQLIDARSFYKKMRKSLGDKRNEFSSDDIDKIFELYRNFEPNEFSKIFDSREFGYTKITVERPQRLNFKVTPNRIENLFTLSTFNNLSISKKKNKEDKLKEELAGKQLQENIIEQLKTIEDRKYTNYDEFYKLVNNKLKSFDLNPTLVKGIVMALSKHDDESEYILDKKGSYIANSNLRDTENVPLLDNIEEYFEREVKKYYPDAWIDDKKNTIGYEINFTKYFYKYEAPRDLKEIQGEIKQVLKEIEELTQEEL